VLDLGIHLIDLLLYALDFPEVEKVRSRLFAKGVAVGGKAEVEDYADVQLALAGDVAAHLSCSWHLQAGREAVIEASFYGTKGGVSLQNVNGSFYDFTGLRYWGTKTETLTQPPDAWGGRALLHWIEQLTQNPDFDSEAQNFLASAEVLDRIYERS
jgi:predicted dehydrogenase